MLMGYLVFQAMVLAQSKTVSGVDMNECVQLLVKSPANKIVSYRPKANDCRVETIQPNHTQVKRELVQNSGRSSWVEPQGPGVIGLYTGDVITLTTHDGWFLTHHMGTYVDGVIHAMKDKQGEASQFTVIGESGNNIYLVNVDKKFQEMLLADREDCISNSCAGVSTCCFPGSRLFQPGKHWQLISVEPVKRNVVRLRFYEWYWVLATKRTKPFVPFNNKWINAIHDSDLGKVPSNLSEFHVQKVGHSFKDEQLIDLKLNTSQMTRNNLSLVLHQQTIENDTPREQTHTLTFTKTIETRKTCNWEKGFQVSKDTTFKADFPYIETSQTRTRSIHFTKGGSKTDSETTTFSESQLVIAPPYMSITATAMVTTAKIEVPYIATMRRVIRDGYGHDIPYDFKLSGIYKGANAYEYVVKFTAKKITKPSRGDGGRIP